ncbi:MAG: efflux RND transporter periplasmic adaptor subunit, partial [bacterium]|nr:efflux RND transporter periplasmic adaptor subunit [bacterium]
TVIATLSRSDLELDLRVLAAELEKARQDYLQLKRGRRKEVIEALRAKVGERQARLKNDELELKRAEDLYKGKILDKASYDRAIANHQSSKSLLLEAQNILREAELGARIEEIAKAKAEVDRMQARIASLRDALSKTVIRSPFTGFLTEKSAEVGQWVQKGGRVAEIIELDRVLVRVPVSERRILLVKEHDTASVAIDAIPGRSFTGLIRRVIPKADPVSRTFPVEIELKNTPDFVIKAGMCARGTRRYGDAAKAILVPKDAVLQRVRGAAVFVFAKGRVREVFFSPGRSIGSFIEVKDSELQPGMAVVVQGNEKLRSGMPVRVGGGGPPGKKGEGGPPGKKGEGGPGKPRADQQKSQPKGNRG